jgi:DNA-directed RNA polymerase sigma subunit (sigma70/sigma32)
MFYYTLEQLIKETEVSVENIKQIINKNYQKLSFRAGARLLSVHSKFYPEQYA